ncbi:hypothetical protein F5887DRAFT_1060585 [Amanita rubescens]|nr:hypothetical protein F5887DRAFT_1060585 [Amanita rubescens]
MSAVDQVICNICKRQFSKYTCPSCNIPYCSLSCFRSQAHSQCSEPFYKNELEIDIHSAPSKSIEERRKMTELLRKFEEESVNDDADDLTTSDDDLDADLARRLQGINLENVNPDELWSLLNAEERSKFMEVLRDPSSELAQQLLSSEELEKSRRKPWWEESEIEGEEDTNHPSKTRPEVVLVPSSMVKPVHASPSLVYNVCAICIAYVYTVRRLATSSLSRLSHDDLDREEAQRTISKLVPFLTDKKSTTLFSSLSEVITDLWSRFDEGEISSQTLSAILQDCVTLLRPLPVTYAPSKQEDLEIDARFHPHLLCSPAIAEDLEVARRKRNQYRIIPKLLFYAAHLLSTPSQVLQFVASQMLIKAQSLQEEYDENCARPPPHVGTIVAKKTATV